MKRATGVGLALYRALARALLPRAFQREYGEELVQAVAARLGAAQGGLASWTVLAAELADLARTAVREWRGTAAGRVTERRNEHGTREAVMEGAWAELMVTLRGLARRPGFALGVTLTIGLGIGATTAIYGVVDGVVLRPLPYEDPSGLVAIGALADAAAPDPATDLQALTGMNSEVYKRYRERARAIAELAALERYMVTISNEDGAEEQIPGVRVSPELFDMLGVSPVLGRAFLPEEYGVFKDGVAMISYEYWQSRYGGDPDALGQAIEATPSSSGPRSIVVGVLPRTFRLPETFFAAGELPQVYAPLPIADPPPGVLLMFDVQGLGRLAPGATLEQARAEAERLPGEISLELAELPRLRRLQSGGIGVNDLHAQTVGATGRSLWVFLGAAALLLLVTSMNAASLLLARALDRTRELGVRVSLGAGRGRVVRLLLAEAGTLSVIGGAIGVALAYGGVAAFLRLAPPSIPRLDSVAVDGRVLFGATLMTLAIAVGSGLLPALRLTARRPWESLQRGGRTASDSTGARTVLVGGQLALAVVLLSSAGLLFTSFIRLRSMDPGFETEGLVVVRTATGGPPRFEGEATLLMRQAWESVEDAVSDVPGVVSAAMANTLPLQAPSWAPRLLLPGDDPEVVREGIAGYVVTPGYAETMGTRVIEGRDLEPSDGADAERVILVNEEFVRTQLEGSEALGALVTRTREGPGGGGDQVVMRIVGVVEDVVQARAEDGPRPAVYLPYGQAEPSQLASFWTVARTAVTPESLAPALRSALGSVDQWPRTVATMQSRLSESHVNPRFQTFLIGAFALIAMLLAAVGLHGSLAHSVRSRQRELGVRMALGADRSSVLRMVLGQGLRVSLAGLAIGIAGTLGLSRVLSSFLYDLAPYDPLTLLGVAAVLIAVSAVACLVPARRATAVDPVRVLQAE